MRIILQEQAEAIVQIVTQDWFGKRRQQGQGELEPNRFTHYQEQRTQDSTIRKEMRASAEHSS
jgi:hypothetical protein